MSHWKKAVLAVVFLYALTVVLLGFFPPEKVHAHGMTIPMLSKRLSMLKKMDQPLQRDRLCIPLSGMCRSIDMQLPEEARVYLPGMLERENARKLGYYFFMTYYLFPRDVDISLNKDLDYVGIGYWANGVEPKTDNELAQNGYHLSLLFADNGGLSTKQHLPLAARDPATVKVFGSMDVFFAFLLPLVAAISGIWLLNLLLPGLRDEIGPGEHFAGGLAVGCVLIAFLVLALRMIGLRFERPLFFIMTIASVAGMVLYFKNNLPNKKTLKEKVLRWEYLLLLPILVVFYFLFSLAAGLESILEFDAVGAWVLKAKMLNHAAGGELFDWFSLRRLSHGHLEYPMMVPTLHAMTFGAIGNVNDFVLKYWALWMLVAFSVGTLSAFGWPSRNRFLAVAAVTTVMFFPRTLQYVRMEGAVIPAVFFATMGSIQCALGFAKKNRDRYLLGLIFLTGALLTRPDGFVFISIWSAATLIVPAGRKLLKPDRRLIIVCALCVLSVLPFKIFRAQLPVLHPQATWVKDALNNPVTVAARAPKLAGIMIHRSLMDDKFADWKAGEGNDVRLECTWNGADSLIQKYFWGYSWVVLYMGIMILIFCKGRRYPALVLFGTYIGIQILLGIVFSSLNHSIIDFQSGIEMTTKDVGGRYMYPAVTAVGAALLALMSCREEEVSSEASTPGT